MGGKYFENNIKKIFYEIRRKKEEVKETQKKIKI